MPLLVEIFTINKVSWDILSLSNLDLPLFVLVFKATLEHTNLFILSNRVLFSWATRPRVPSSSNPNKVCLSYLLKTNEKINSLMLFEPGDWRNSKLCLGFVLQPTSLLSICYINKLYPPISINSITWSDRAVWGSLLLFNRQSVRVHAYCHGFWKEWEDLMFDHIHKYWNKLPFFKSQNTE